MKNPIIAWVCLGIEIALYSVDPSTFLLVCMVFVATVAGFNTGIWGEKRWGAR